MSTLQHLLTDRDRSKDKKLTHATGIPAERINALAAGAEAALSELLKIAGFLRLDLRDLLPRSAKQSSADLLFRSTALASDDLTMGNLSRRIGSSVDLLPAGIARNVSWLGHFHRDGKTYENAERNANAFRHLFFGGDELGPLLALPRIAMHEMGILLFVIQSPRIDGASAFFEGLPFVFVADRGFAPRMLFTLAHEVGHLIAHHDPSRSFAVVDFDSEKRQPKKQEDEFYAHAFASCLLMPAAGVATTLKKIRSLQAMANAELGDLEILLLARIYGVSFYAAAKRCEDLQLLPRGGAASLDERLKQEFGSAEKRADQANLPPRPRIAFPKLPTPLLEAALQKIQSGEMSIGKASAVLGLSIADLLSANAPAKH